MAGNILADRGIVAQCVSTAGYPLLIFLLWSAAIAIFIGNRGLWSPDEPRYLQVAWEMAQAKQFFVPVFNGETYAEKPPLFFWLAIGIGKLVHFEQATRWVSALAGLGTLLLTYALGARMFSPQKGFLGALILMTSGFFTWLMANGNIDMLLTFWITLSVYCFALFVERRDARWMIAAYAACGLGVLAKGPVGFMLPWLFFIFWTGHEAASGRRPEWRHLLWGVPITLIPVILWLIPACASGGWEYTQTILIKQNLGRAVNSFAHAEPWYSYLVDFPAIALPWSIAFIGTVPAIIQSVRNKDRNILFCVLWFSTVFIFFTLISGKRSRYIVPLLPAYSIMLSYSITYTQNSRIQRVLIDAVNTLIILTAASFLLFPFFQPFLAQYIHELHGFGENMPWWRVVFLYAGGLLSLFIIFYKYTIFRNFDPAKRIYIASTAFIILFICAQLYYFPALDHIKSARYAAEDICRIKPEDAQVSFWKGRYNEGWNYYLQQDQIPVLNEKTVQPAVHRVILAKADYDKQPLLSAGYGAVRSYQVGSDDFRLYVKR